MDLNNISTNNKNWLRTIGLYQVIGGTIGIVVMLPYFNFDDILANILLLILSILLFIFSIYAGLTLFRLKILGAKLTFINQILQTFSFAVSTFYFCYVSGLAFNITADFTDSANFGISFHISTFSFILDEDTEHTFFAVNLIPIFIIIMTEKISGQSNNAIKTKHYA